ncbi:ZIP family metal transporter [Candidatus Falkowbacteria bacterium]|nr:ZIP family metal transporter [Candidatus Falkowbacteria bacterium]
MNLINLYIFGSVTLVSLISMIGVFFLLTSEERVNRLIMLLVSLSTGTLLGDAVIHILPEAVESSTDQMRTWYYFLIGLLIFFILEKIIHWHHCHNHEDCDHRKTLGIMNLVGDGLHNFIDGAILAAAFLTSTSLGIATLIAVIAHEVPQEIGDLGVLFHAGYSRTRAILLNFASALASFVGAIMTIILSNQIGNFNDYILPITAGGFIYIAAADLIPELKKDTAPHKSLIQLCGILIGIAAMVMLKRLG